MESKAQNGAALRPGVACDAKREDGKFYSAQVVGMASNLPRRYKVRYDDTGDEAFVLEQDINVTPQTAVQTPEEVCATAERTHNKNGQREPVSDEESDD